MHSFEGTVCSHCGHDNSKRLNEQKGTILAEGTIIKGRYLLGLALKKNSESVVYIGYDTIKNSRVHIREFFPEGLCIRNSNNEISIASGFEIQFKGLMTDFVELSRQLMEIPPNGVIIRVIDLLADNGTIYAIYEHTECISLNQFLRQNGGELSWEEAEPMFMPLLYAIKLLNAHGVVHRGISLDTIEVTGDRELKLKGICTSAVRAINTELTPELFSGFSAPEQYQKCSSHGEWTDVYAICAVLYRVLTGTAPASAELRDPDLPVMDPHSINSSIPYSVCETLIKGMEYDKNERILSVKELIVSLYNQPVRMAAPVNIHQDIPQPLREKGPKFKPPFWLVVILVTLPIMLILFFMLYNVMLGPKESASSAPSSELMTSSDMVSSDNDVSSDNASSEESAPVEETIVVEDFAGKYYDDIISTELYSDWFVFEKKEEYNETLSVGEIVSQEPEAKKLVPKGTKIVLTVSLGQETVLVPPITDGSGNKISVADYQKYFEDNGVKVKIEKIDSLNVLSGEIDSLSVQEGSTINRKTANEIVIYVAN